MPCTPARPFAQAADALRLTGVGRNEFIATSNAVRAKRLLWRVNKGIARDALPTEPRDVQMDGWWGVQVVNVGARRAWQEVEIVVLVVLVARRDVCVCVCYCGILTTVA